MLTRAELVLGPLDMKGRGLEIAPYFNPLVLKSENNVAYTDYLGTEQLRAKAAMNPDAVNHLVPAVDFVWTPGQALSTCTDERFDYAVASHVLEHVPDPVGWLNEVLSVLRTGAVVALCLPDRRRTMDYYRHESSLGDVVGSWIDGPSLPTPAQVMDFLSQSFRDDSKAASPITAGLAFADAPRLYSDQNALEFAFFTVREHHYLDIHCTVWTPNSFSDVFHRVAELGILNVAISAPIENAGNSEFIVHLTKLGEPAVQRPSLPHPLPHKTLTFSVPSGNERRGRGVLLSARLRPLWSQLRSWDSCRWIGRLPGLHG